MNNISEEKTEGARMRKKRLGAKRDPRACSLSDLCPKVLPSRVSGPIM